MFNTVQILSSLWLSQIPLDTDLILVVCSLYSLFTLITLAYVTPVLGTCVVFRDNIQIVILRHRKLNKLKDYTPLFTYGKLYGSSFWLMFAMFLKWFNFIAV